MTRNDQAGRTARESRSITAYGSLACVTIVAGLASRHFRSDLPSFIAAYAGDTLWATMAFLLVALLLPRSSTMRIACIALCVAFAVEFSQLYHAPWIDGIRATRVGALALGSDFVVTDLVCYTVGVVLGAALDSALRRRAIGAQS